MVGVVDTPVNRGPLLPLPGQLVLAVCLGQEGRHDLKHNTMQTRINQKMQL